LAEQWTENLVIALRDTFALSHSYEQDRRRKNKNDRRTVNMASTVLCLRAARGFWLAFRYVRGYNARVVNAQQSAKESDQNMKTTTPHSRNSIGPERFRGFILIPLALCCFALCSALRAVTPAPDGAYPGANTAEGQSALFSLTSGINNTALGFQALYHDTTGSNNAATGFRALYLNTSGVNNTATGAGTLFSNSNGNDNTANGNQALYSNTTGSNNTASGNQALYYNTAGVENTANGYQALYRNTFGFQNTANGKQALFSNTTGNDNTATGWWALYSNGRGIENTATGELSLISNTSGNDNTADGVRALPINTTGGGNTAVGVEALYGNFIGNNNTAIGNGAGRDVTTASNVICIGANVIGENVSNSCFIGSSQTAITFIGGIYGKNEGGTISAVYINSLGRLGTQGPPSSRRFKKEIKPMGETSEAILALQPVTFQYKSDPTGMAQFGLVAEEVANIDPDLVVRDADGKPYSVRYEAVNAMLLNEFLKEHRKVQEQEATITQLKNDLQTSIAQLSARLEQQDSKIEKVSTQLELNKAAPRTVLNNQSGARNIENRSGKAWREP
jgi:hypothetical protein